MTDSELSPHKDKSPIAAPPQPAYVRGKRISLEQAGIEKPPIVKAEEVKSPKELELDDFGLPVRRRDSRSSQHTATEEKDEEDGEGREKDTGAFAVFRRRSRSRSLQGHGRSQSLSKVEETKQDIGDGEEETDRSRGRFPLFRRRSTSAQRENRSRSLGGERSRASSIHGPRPNGDSLPHSIEEAPETPSIPDKLRRDTLTKVGENGAVVPSGGISEWSHQALAPQKVSIEAAKEEEWQAMPAYGKYDLYDDDGQLVARGTHDSGSEPDTYEDLGGAKKGYTRVQIDDDAASATSMDENTSYLFRDQGTNVVDEDEAQRDPLAQMQATKHLLTEGQRIAYVGVTRLAMVKMVRVLEEMQERVRDGTTTVKVPKRELAHAVESMKMWAQKMMVRLYAHMDIDSSEQVMIEQLPQHGVQPEDLTPALMRNARVKNPMAGVVEETPSLSSSSLATGLALASPKVDAEENAELRRRPSVAGSRRESECPSPPAYELHANEELPEVRNPAMLPSTRNIDLDIRWTVLCDLFLVLIADSIYDARSRVLLEAVGAAMAVPWLDICRFEKRVTDALEMQEAAARENWDEAEHMEARRKMALKRKYMMMGLATVGGSLVIGLSAGLLAPVIGAGLAAGFTTIGVAGTGGFLAGAGGTALITTGAVLSGGTIAVRASHRRTGAVRTFEYRPLHNNKRVNLIVTISGWMNGKVDDVRLPFSTIDPIMGDMYSVLWEPDMLQSMGDTIRILATEALTQGLQQVLASTILTALMASLTLPIVLTKLSYLIDNPWAVSLDRADAAGLILADSLIERNLGVRPITLVGFSLGSRVIFSCLRELASKSAYGLVQNVYLFGSPIVAKKEEYLRARTVVSGRLVNGYASNDWILGYLFRATSGGISRIAGLHPVEEIPGLENLNVTPYVNGHMAYRAAMPRLLREVGWAVESDVFSEIEDPDPENHERRQRELIREIEGARKEAEAKPGKKRFWAWGRGKEKKGWETYDERAMEGAEGGGAKEEEAKSGVLFDIDAIRKELQSEQYDSTPLEVRQLESTLPPMKLELNDSPAKAPPIEPTTAHETPPPPLYSSKSFDAALPTLASRPSRTTSASPSPNGTFHDASEHYAELPQSTSDHTAITLTFDPPASAMRGWQEAETGPETSRPPTPQRLEVRSLPTVPVGSVGRGVLLERNAWAEEEEEEEEEGEGWGREGEVRLSFA